MLNGNADVHVREVSLDTARNLAKFCTSAVGHADTAAVFADVLGFRYPPIGSL
jgi:hypothetical protein